MKRNEKGLTLIELIVSMLILSIASLMFFSSFSVVLRLMKEGADIKNASADIVAMLDGNAVDDGDVPIISTNTLAKASLTLSDSSIIRVEGTAYHATKAYGSDTDDMVHLEKFTTHALTKNEKSALKMSGILDSVGGIGLSKTFIDNLSKEEKQQICDEIGRTNFWPNNDVFIDYLYKKYLKEINNVESYVWPTIDISNMKLHDGSTIVIKDRVLDTLMELYVVPYFIDPTNGLYLLSARTTPAIDRPNWNAYLIFNDDDQHWYYRESSYELTKLTNKSEAEWNALKANMRKGEDGWQRIFENE